jgi:hypothetical protein
MAFTSCVRCEGKSFEIAATTPVAGANFELVFVQCSRCGGAVAVLDTENLGAMLSGVLDRLTKIEADLRLLRLVG